MSLAELGGLDLMRMAAWTIDGLALLRRASQHLDLSRAIAIARG